ncbi:hypothetical protein ACX9A9_000155 [Escherichia coli]
MKEYHGEKRYKDYLLKRYSISREGHQYYQGKVPVSPPAIYLLKSLSQHEEV